MNLISRSLNRQPTDGSRAPRLAALAGTMGTIMLAAHAQTQDMSATCERLKAALSARIEAGGVRGYGLDPLPANAPLPPGTRVIGTCDGGATKMVYRRFAAAPAAEPAAAPAPRVHASPPAHSSPPHALKPAPVAVQAPAPAPAPFTAMGPAARLAGTPAEAAPSPVATPTSAPEPVAVGAQESSERISPTRLEQALAAAREGSPWWWTLPALPLGVWFWNWRSRRKLYDKAGLPRGPKL